MASSKFFVVIGVVLLLLWGVIYTAAYVEMRGEVKVLRAEIARQAEISKERSRASETLAEDARRNQAELLAYVVTLREKLAATGFSVPPMLEAEDEE